MLNTALLKLIRNAYFNSRYTLENLIDFTKVGTLTKEHFLEITGFVFDEIN